MGLALEGEPRTGAVLAGIHDFIGVFQQEVAAEAGLLAPSLIDAVNGVGAADHLFAEVNHALTLVAVVVDDDVYRAVLLRRDTEHGRMTASRQFYPQALVGQTHGVVMRVRHLLRMREPGGPFLWLQTQFAADGCNGERAIVLRATAHYPVAVAEALQQ